MDTTRETMWMQGVMLAGVHAWGESALEQVCPRPLLPVIGRPLAWYVLDWLRREGVPRASICANSDTRVFRECLAGTALNGMAVTYYEDTMPRGPAGCVRDAACPEADTLVVVEAAVATDIDLGQLLEAHRQAKAALTTVVTGSAPAEPAGLYVLSRGALALIPEKGYQDIKEGLIPRLYGRGETVLAYRVDGGRTLRVRDASSYLAASSWALETPSPAWQMPDSYRRSGQAYVHATAEVAGTARLVGAVVVGPRCTVEDGATIVGSTTVGMGCRIGADAVVSRTAIWTGCRVEPGAIVDHCVLVHGAAVPPGGEARDTVCLPGKTLSLDTRAFYWSLEIPSPGSAPNLLDMILAPGRTDGRRTGSGLKGWRIPGLPAAAGRGQQEARAGGA